MKKILKVALSALLISTMLIPAASFADNTSNSVTSTSTTKTTTSTTASTTTNTPATSSHHIAGLPNEPVYESNPNIYIEGKKVDFRNTQELDRSTIPNKIVTVSRPILVVRGRTMLPLRAFIYYITNYIDTIKSDTTNPIDVVYWHPGYKSNRPDGFIIDSVRYDNTLSYHYNVPADPWKLGFFIRMPYIAKWTQNPNPYHYILYKTDVPPLIMDDGVTYLPLRAEANAFGYGVKFDQATNSIYISKNLPIEYGDQFQKITDVVPPNGMISGNVGVKAFDSTNGTLLTMTDTHGNYTTQYVEPWK